jgi:hypothetical protein
MGFRSCREMGVLLIQGRQWQFSKIKPDKVMFTVNISTGYARGKVVMALQRMTQSGEIF